MDILSIQSDVDGLKEEVQRRELHRFALSIHWLAQKIQIVEDFTSATPCKLARLISETAKLVAQNLHAAPIENLTLLNDFLTWIASHLRFVDRARITQTPWSIIPIAESFLKEQIGPASNFIIRPTWSYNYSIIGEFWDNYSNMLKDFSWFPLEELKEKVGLNNETIYCISFPRVERNNSLMHVNWGHEVGHILADRWERSDFDDMWQSVQPQIQLKIETNVRTDPSPFLPLFQEFAIKKFVSSSMQQIKDTTIGGIKELVCDIIGVHLFGPAAIAAAFEFSSRLNFDVSPLQCPYYPPWRYRLRKMIQYCKKDIDSNLNNSLDSFTDWLCKVEKLTESQEDIETLNSSIITEEAYNFIAINYNHIIKKVISYLPQTSQIQYNFHGRFEIIEKLIHRLNQKIPPNEVSNLSDNPASFQDIISAAWTYKIANEYGHTTDKSEEKTIEDLNVLYNLILKACESSYVHRTFGPALRGENK